MIKQEWINTYITWRNYFNKGRGEFSWIRDTAKDFVYVLASIWLLGNNPLLGAAIITGFVAYTLACPLFGWWWDKRKFFNNEADWGYKRSGLGHLMKVKK